MRGIRDGSNIRGMRDGTNRGGMRDGSDRGGRGDNIIMMQHDSRLVGGSKSGKGSQMSLVGSDIDYPTFYDPHGPDTISDQEDFESDGDSKGGYC